MLSRFRQYRLADLVGPGMRDNMMCACNLCGYDGKFTLLASEASSADILKPLIGAHAQTATVMCPNCGWTFKPGRLTSSQLTTLYSRRGGSATTNPAVIDTTNTRSEGIRAYIETSAGRVFENEAVLDVGGGTGQVSVAFTRTNCQVDLLDVGGVAPIDKTMRVISSSFDDFESDRRYDLIILSHVLEHTWEPLQWLKRARALLTPSGVVFVEVPFEFYTPYIKGKLGDPCHVGYFSLRTLAECFHLAGLAVVALDRTLAQYDARSVMAIRAVGSANSNGKPASNSRNIGSALRMNILEMMHPHQLMLALLRR